MNKLFACSWQGFLDKDLPVILWGIIIIGAVLLILKMVKSVFEQYLKFKYETAPGKKYDHEIQLKKDAFEREEAWASFNLVKELVQKADLSTDESQKKVIKDLRGQIQKMKDEAAAEKTKRDKKEGDLDYQISLYEKILKQIDIRLSIDAKQKTEPKEPESNKSENNKESENKEL